MKITAMIRRTVYVGTFIHCASLGELQVLENAAVTVDDETGKILVVECPVGAEMLEMWAGEPGTRVVKAGEGQFFFPGFVGMLYSSTPTPTLPPSPSLLF